MVVPLTLRPVLVETGSADEDGRLVFVRDRLVAVLVRLSAAAHPDPDSGLRGKWFVEAGFGPCAAQAPDVFPALADAEAWVRRALARGARPIPASGA